MADAHSFAPADQDRILVVNDRTDQLAAIQVMLEPLKLHVVTAEDGEAALRLLLKHEFAVTLLDVNMPGMDGFEIAATIRSRPRTELTPIIFVSATNQGEVDRLRGYEIGAFDYVNVPVDPAILRAKVAAFVRMHRMNAEIKRQAADLARLNHELGVQAQQLAALNHELESFSYSVSHDLRAPLRRIDQFSSLLVSEHSDALPEDGRFLVGRIRDNTVRMTGLIDDLLALSQVGRAPLAIAPIDISALTETVMQTLRAQEPARQVEVDIAPGLIVHGDHGLVRAVLENLLGNAWKYTGKRPVAHIAVEPCSDTDGQVGFVVRDDGAGFDMAYAGKLFSPFQRFHGADEFPGTGIGLSIVARIVSRHGGKIWAESAVDRGSAFHVVLEPKAAAIASAS